jgi:DNA-binding MarR family transcriptional regulator
MGAIKTSKQLERHFKGVGNHHRIDILLLLSQSKDLTLEQISERLECNIKTISGHTYRLVQSGLINKTYSGRSVLHSLSPYGKKIVSFLEIFSQIK